MSNKITEFKIKPDMQSKWKEALANNTDAYGRRCFTYAADWASLMESELAAGKELKDVAKETSHKADTDGITGFMYGKAVSILAHVWEHGEALRQWHNLDTQIGNEGEKANREGGTLNPAILNIQT